MNTFDADYALYQAQARLEAIAASPSPNRRALQAAIDAVHAARAVADDAWRLWRETPVRALT